MVKDTDAGAQAQVRDEGRLGTALSTRAREPAVQGPVECSRTERRMSQVPRTFHVIFAVY